LRLAAIALTIPQATAFGELGKTLGSKKEWWGDDDDSSTGVAEKSIIHCSPRVDGRWDVTVLNAVGIITTDDLDLFVEPKIPIAHVVHLFSCSDQFPRLTDSRLKTQIATGDLLWHALAHWFIWSVEQVLRGELIRDYRPTSQALPQARGHINVFATTQNFLAGRLRIECEFDEFDADNPLNRILKSALVIVQQMPGLNTLIRDQAARGLLRFDDVGPLRHSDLHAWVDRHASRYSDAVALAKNFLRGTARSIELGQASARCFLLRTPDLIEAGIRSILKRSLCDVCPVKKSGVGIDGLKMTLNPDLVFGDLGIGDVKYKLSDDWIRSDLYQGISFAVGFEVKRCGIISFSKQDNVPVKTLSIGNIEVVQFRWPTGSEPENAEQQLARQVKAWIVGTNTIPTVKLQEQGQSAGSGAVHI
jgi:5-methylcytosine-specific restriction enzyme subunit McrC